MKKLLSILIVLLFALPGWGANYYVRPAGHDTNCNGTADVDDSEGVRPACAYKTVDKVWTVSVGVNEDITAYVRGGTSGSPVTYSVGAVIGGADTGNTMTINFDAYVILKMADASQAYGFRVGETNTTVNFVGQAGWPKTVEIDQGTDVAAGTAINNKQFFYSNQAGTTIRVYDIDFNAVGASTGAKLYYASAGGVLDIGFYRCYIHDFDTGLPAINTSGPFTLEASFVEDCDPIKNAQTSGTAQNFKAVNNTFLDDNGTGNQIAITLTGSGTNAHTIDVRNNLFISNVDAATLYGPLYAAAEEFRSFGGTLMVGNNAAWKTAMPTTTARAINNYPYVSSNAYAGEDPDYWPALYTDLLVVNPAAATLPEIGSTSLLIGRGANTGVTTGINGVSYPSNSIGAWAVSGGTKQYLTPTNNKIMIVGHSYVDNTGGNVKWPDYLEDKAGITGVYTLAGMPGRETSCDSEPCWATFSGSMSFRNSGAYTELAQYHAPEWIIYNGDSAAWRTYGTRWNNELEENIIKATITNLKSLYREGDVKIIYMGSPPDDATSNTSTRADQIESDMATWIVGYKYIHAGNMLARFKTAGGADWGDDYFSDGVHPDVTGMAFIADWLDDLIIQNDKNPRRMLLQ